LIELYLDNNELESLDDAHLAKLKDLNVLSIAHNKLKALPASIGRLYKLKQLLINNNKLSSPLPYTLANANQLRVINANVNQLTAAFDVSNGEPLCFPVLQKLELHRNRLSSLTTPAAAAPLEFPELQELDLSQNRLYHLDDLLTTTPKLLALDISQNIFSEWPAGIFSLSNLHRLSIANNEFTSLALHLCLLEGLRAFSFEGNPIRVLPRVTGAQAILERLRNRLPERGKFIILGIMTLLSKLTL
jgi:Leucine-rich repeat (LRR) protein